MIKSLLALNGRHIGGVALAKEAISLEQNEMNEVVGFQDQCASAMGSLVYIKASQEGIKPQKFVARQGYIDYICENLLLGFNGNSGTPSFLHPRPLILFVKLVLNLLQDLAGYSRTGIDLFSAEADITDHANVTKLCRDIKLTLNGDNTNVDVVSLIESTENVDIKTWVDVSISSSGSEIVFYE